MGTKQTTLSRSRDGLQSAQEGTSGADQAAGQVAGFEALRLVRGDGRECVAHWRVAGAGATVCGARVPLSGPRLRILSAPSLLGRERRCRHINCRLLWQASADVVADREPFSTFPRIDRDLCAPALPIAHWGSDYNTMLSACGQVDIDHYDSVAASDVAKAFRCRRTGCRARWTAYDRVVRMRTAIVLDGASGDENLVDTSGKRRRRVRELLGARLFAARTQAKLTQEEAAWALDWNQPSLARVEKGEKPLDVEQFIFLCELYGVSPADILGEFVWRL